MLSIDPTIRTWMDDAPGYLPPIEIGAVVRGSGPGVVVESRSERYAVGDIVFGMTTGRSGCSPRPRPLYGRSRGPRTRPRDGDERARRDGHHRLLRHGRGGRVTPGDVVVVSGAAGATGSVAGQIARAEGPARSLASPGERRSALRSSRRYGFDACLDYREEHLRRRLREACPEGVDLYFDNVGGEILDTVLTTLALRRSHRAVRGDLPVQRERAAAGIENTSALITRRARMEGFLILDYASRFAEAQMELAGLVLSGAAHITKSTCLTALERAPEALNLLFTGGNHGKMLVAVDESVHLG